MLLLASVDVPIG